MIEIVLLIPSRGANSGELFAGSRSSERRIKGERVRRRVAEITIDYTGGEEREEVDEEEVVDGCSAPRRSRGEGWITAEAEIVISLAAAGFGYQRPWPRSVYAWYRRHRIQRAREYTSTTARICFAYLALNVAYRSSPFAPRTHG